MADNEMCLNAARAVYPNDEDLRVAYMLGFNDGYERRESEQPSLPEGLEEAAEKYRRNSCNAALRPNVDGPTPEYGGSIKGAFIAGAKWQAEKCDEETSKLLYAERQTAYIHGWDDHKEQMLKEAAEFECIGKKVKMTIQELINYYIDQECCDVADECGF